jgi:Cdc6-like AAA superfamily ATPase
MLFLYKEGFDGVQDYVDLLNECLIDFQEDTGNKINAMVLSPSGLEIETVGITDYDSENIETYYSGKTFKAMEKAVKRIKGSKRGMTILYGPRGTGKTTSINYIADGLDRIVIFIPNNMIEHTINNPDFRKFLKRFDQPIIVIDDCELALNEIYNKSNVTTTNLVQMVDGFLAGTTDVSIVTIFNTDSEDDIDHNLLDCNSLLDVVEFTELSASECNDLSKIVDGRKYKSSAKMIDVVKKRKGEQKEKVGF